MTIRSPILGACCASLLFLVDSSCALAIQSSDTLLSSASRGYVSIADITGLNENWRRTQMGQLVHDEAMAPFMADMRRQLQRKFTGLGDKLGIAFEDFQSIASGEIGFGLIERADERAALAFTVVVEHRSAQVEEFLAKVDAELSLRKARKSLEESGDTPLVVYDIPARDENDIARQAIFFQRDGMLCGSDSRDEVEEMLARFGNQAGDSLADVKAYRETMRRCQAESAELVPEVRWYVDPFGYARAMNSQVRRKNPHAKDFVQILTSQGFDAIQGAGGHVNLAVGGAYELLHRTSVYAPAVNESDAGKGAAEKYRQAMRIMEFPNGDGLAPQAWAPRKLASYRTFHFNFQNGFEHIDTLVDAIQGYPGAFEAVVEGVLEDPFGARVDIRKEIVAHLGRRVTLMTDYQVPITTKSERFLFFVEVTDSTAISKAIDKMMEVDPNAQKLTIEGHVVWEISQPTDEFAELEIGFGELDPLAPDNPPNAPNHRQSGGPMLVGSAAVCIFDGHLIAASHLEYLRTILTTAATSDNLAAAGDYGEVELALNQLLDEPAAARCFVRTDEAYRPTYELLRQGKMPEAETLLGRLLNRMLTPEEEGEGVLRKQKIDGRQLPNFEMVRRYFSPSGTVVRSDDDGWMIVGATLAKRVPQARADSRHEESTPRR